MMCESKNLDKIQSNACYNKKLYNFTYNEYETDNFVITDSLCDHSNLDVA